MRKFLKLMAVTLSLLMVLSACGKSESVTPGITDKNQGASSEVSKSESENSVPKEDNTESETESTVSQAPATFTDGDDEMFTNRDQNTSYSEKSSVIINLKDNGTECDSNLVEINGNTVEIQGEGDFILRGELSDGQIIVNAGENDKPHLIFDGVNVTSKNSAPLYIIEADKVTVTLVNENTLASGEKFTQTDENNIDGAVFSKQDLSFNGEGVLNISSPAGHGIVCKDDLVFVGGTVNITSASHGIDANDSVRVKDSVINIASGKDGIHAENNDDGELGFIYISNMTADITAEGDGISAGNYLQIENGIFNITTGGGSENAAQKTSENWGMMGGGMGDMGHGGDMGGGRPGRPGAITTVNYVTSSEIEEDASTSIKGIKAVNSLLINNGSFVIDSADDAVHSNLNVTVNNGTFDIESGDDGFHADEELNINGGTINIKESYEGLEGLNVLINGGDIDILSGDDGINAAGGTDQSGMGGMRGGDMFGGPGGGPGGGMGSSNGSIIINGGNIYIQASGDGIDANGYLEIHGGYTVVCGPTQGDTAVLDYDTKAEITGGTFIGTGSSMMAQTFSGGTQGVIALSVGNQQAGTNITVKDSSGNEIINETPELNYQIMIVSSPEIIKGESYEVAVGASGGTFDAQ